MMYLCSHDLIIEPVSLFIHYKYSDKDIHIIIFLVLVAGSLFKNYAYVYHPRQLLLQHSKTFLLNLYDLIN